MLQKVQAIFVNGPLSKKFWEEVHIRSAFDKTLVFDQYTAFDLDLEIKGATLSRQIFGVVFLFKFHISTGPFS